MESVILASELFQYLVKHEFQKLAPYYGPDIKKALHGDVLEKTWQSFIANTGPVLNVTDITPTQILAFHAVVVSCKCERSSMNVIFSFDDENRIAGLNFAPLASSLDDSGYAIPPYGNKDLFKEELVVVGEGKWALEGKLTVPVSSNQKFPCVILVHGSGSHDEDETIGPNKPFKDLAYGLSSKQVAVLRYVKRIRQYGETMTATEIDDLTLMEETVNDAVLAVDAAAKHTSIDKDNIFVLGHSLGGYACPLIAKLTGSKVKGVISLAGSLRDLAEMILDQIVYIQSLNGACNVAMIEAIRAGVQKIKDPALPMSTPRSELLNVAPKYWYFLRGYDPIKILKETTHPILVIHADRDYQATHDDLALWKIISYDPRATYRQYPYLNHLMIKVSDPSIDLNKKATPDEYGIAGHVEEEVVVDIVAWVNKTKRSNRKVGEMNSQQGEGRDADGQEEEQVAGKDEALLRTSSCNIL